MPMFWWMAVGCTYPLQVQHNVTSLAEAYTTVTVEVGAGEVRVTGWEGATEVASVAHWHGRTPEVRVERVGAELRVVAECPSPHVFCSTVLELRVPSEVGLQIEVNAGDVHVSGVRGATRVRTSAGSILVDHLDGPLDLETSLGSVVGTDVRSRTVRASTAAGAVNLDLAVEPARVEVEVGAGGIDLKLPSGAYDLRTQVLGELVISGVTSDPTAPAIVDLSTGIGSIHVHGTVVEEGPLAIPGATL